MDCSQAASIARELINIHLSNDWNFQWDRAKRRAGCCKFRTKLITLSVYYVQRNNEADIRDTILHEIAHALAGPGHHHDNHWKNICVRIGAKPERCYDGEKIDMPQGRWQGTCPTCKQVFRRHRRPRRTTAYTYCLKCGPDQGRIQYQLVG